MAFKMAPKSPAKQTGAGGWSNPTSDPIVLANRKAADAKLKANQDRNAKAKSVQVRSIQVKSNNENDSKYKRAKAISISKDKSNDIMYGSWTNRQKADKTLKELSDSGYKPAAKPAAKPATKPVAKKPEVKKTESKPAAATTSKPAASNNYEKANKGGALDKLVAARNSAKKGSAEYAAAQNSINESLGSKVRHKVKEALPEIKAASVTKTAAPEIKAEVKIESPAKKKVVEKKTGEKYASKAAMMKHEKSESKAEMKKEYGKKSPAKMKKC